MARGNSATGAGSQTQLRTAAENKKRGNGEDFNLHPLSYHPSPRLTTHPALSFAELGSLATFSGGAAHRRQGARAGRGMAARGGRGKGPGRKTRRRRREATEAGGWRGWREGGKRLEIS